MKRALISTAALTLSLLTAGAGTAVAADVPDPSASPSPSISPSPSPSAEPDADVMALEPTLGLAPNFTCDEDPSDDFQIPQDGDGVTYTLEDGIFTAALEEGYVWGEGPVNWDPWTDPIYEEPPYIEPEPGTTDPYVRAVADYAFPNCNHNDETTVNVTTECTDGMGYLVYDIDAWWATDETSVAIYPYTSDEAAQGRTVYDGNTLSGRLAWDGSTPGMTGPIAVGYGDEIYDPEETAVSDPIFWIHTGEGRDIHEALAMLRFESADPCLGVDGGTGDGEGEGAADGSDDDELAATGPEAAWLTAGVAALLVAAGAALVVVRRRLGA
ncbi:hypothetical protein [Promicromonospora soli]|uniref:LPXTG-motif cell wall-anchored protein n=1 Tax=Promicromonospora soli TaxID=2035533 RepID=A0A919L072_9MICO|nr:hypothetical protein [Promicromonospora soli]GHH78594.1 hypothetical protein GCM10017772_42340 [Promicromonospora soli]